MTAAAPRAARRAGRPAGRVGVRGGGVERGGRCIAVADILKNAGGMQGSAAVTLQSFTTTQNGGHKGVLAQFAAHAVLQNANDEDTIL